MLSQGATTFHLSLLFLKLLRSYPQLLLRDNTGVIRAEAVRRAWRLYFYLFFWFMYFYHTIQANSHLKISLFFFLLYFPPFLCPWVLSQYVSSKLNEIACPDVKKTNFPSIPILQPISERLRVASVRLYLYLYKPCQSVRVLVRRIRVKAAKKKKKKKKKP